MLVGVLDHRGWVASGMRLWKRRPLQKVFGRERPMVFEADPAKARSRAEAEGRRRMAWAGKAGDGDAVVRVEDGFLRSRGLLIPKHPQITTGRLRAALPGCPSSHQPVALGSLWLPLVPAVQPWLHRGDQG